MLLIFDFYVNNYKTQFFDFTFILGFYFFNVVF